MKKLLLFLSLYCVSAIGYAQEQLAKDPQWLALLHMDASHQSKIKQSHFFLAATGNNDPEAELQATIAALKAKDSNTQCLFPARYEWLVSKLPDVAALTRTECKDLQNWYSAISPSKAALIFASSFINNPASAFGHTFLRLEQNNSEDLLAYSSNFAAATSGEDALTYAAKGIFGGYDGFYSIMPYYSKVNEYSDLENRDIWEYQLNLTSGEVRRMVLHIWELREAPANYYYFDENCSYQILELLRVARPSLQTQMEFFYWVIPVDTIRKVENIISGVKFRPSAQTSLKNRISRASEKQREEALAIANPNNSVELLDKDAETLDLAYELLTYRKIAGQYPAELANPRSFEILSARGKNPKIDAVPQVTMPEVKPQEGHGTSQLALLQGRKGDLWFNRAVARPAFHDLLDPQAGYIKGSQIKFFELALDLTESDNLDLGYFSALDITSINPVDDFFTPLSWNVRTGLKRNIIRERDESLTSYLGGSLGRSWKLFEENNGYILFDTEIRANKHYDTDTNPGAGAKAGILSYTTDNFALQSEISFLRFAEQKYFAISVDARYSLGKNSSLVAKFEQQREYDRKQNVVGLGVEWFFTP